VDDAALVQLVEVGGGLAVRNKLALVPGLDGHALLAARLLEVAVVDCRHLLLS
jgi:hypothetical protein